MGMEKLTIKPPTGDPVVAMYNPAELTVEKRNQFRRQAIPGLPTPVTQFVSGETLTVSLDLFFDTYEQHEDVRDYSNRVFNLTRIDPTTHAPPICGFSWGGLAPLGDERELRGVVDSVSQKFTMFLDNGRPVRATLAVKISEYKALTDQLEEIKPESADKTKYRMFKEGDSLWMWAFREYGDPSLWRVIAKNNNIDNPRIITAGTQLSLPPLEEDIEI
jgi:hypothetical protein